MNYNELVLEYINEYPYDEPIFAEDIKDYVKSNLNGNIDIFKIMKNINVFLNRLTKKNTLCSYMRGIYYKPTIGIFGIKSLNTDKVILKRYIKDNNNIKGYLAGAALFNALGLTTQVPRYKLIATNECPNDNYYDIKKLCITIKKPKIEINNENYLYLQLLDLLQNKEQIKVEVDNEKEIIYNHIKENNLEFEKIFMYANLTNNKRAIDHLYKLG